MRRGAAVISAWVLVFGGGQAARAFETLENAEIRAEFDDNGLVALHDKSLGRTLEFSGDHWSFVIDHHLVDSRYVRAKKHAREADYVGMISGKRENKFETTGLTPIKSGLVDAPFVDEFPMILECNVIHTHEIGLHTQFIGEILDVKVDEAALTEQGLPDMDKVAPFIYGSEIQTYHRIGDPIGRAFDIGKKL